MKGKRHLLFSLVRQEKGKGRRLEGKRWSEKHADLEEAEDRGESWKDLHHKEKPPTALSSFKFEQRCSLTSLHFRRSAVLLITGSA